MKPGIRRCALVIFMAALIAGSVTPAFAAQANSVPLCAYWEPHIRQWADLITKYAGNNGLDPNLIAALVEEESQGNPSLVSRAGAVGLMQIMPYEAGFTWRPRAGVLKKPEANLEWGTHTFNEVLRQAQGRMTLAVLAYNSGWDRIQLRSTRLFAAKVLDHYARCIVSQRGLNPEDLQGYQVYVVAHSSAGPAYADRFNSDGTFEPIPDFDPVSLSPDLPHAVAFAQLDEDYIAWWVDVWVDARVNEPLKNTLLYPDRTRTQLTLASAF